MATNTTLQTTLHPAASDTTAANALPTLVPRITNERDGFKNVSVAKLRQEINDEAAGITHTAVADSDKPKDVQTQQKELFLAKNELLSFLAQAKDPIAMALDTVSFQLRDQAPQLANQTLSPFVKENFPRGSLVVDRVEPKGPSEAESKESMSTATGWSLRNLSRAAEGLLGSARGLEREAERESRYWRGVSEVKQRGWGIERMGRRGMGVRIGSAEAGPTFQSQSLVPLRANDAGDLTLSISEEKVVRVRIEDNGRVLGQSTTTTPDTEGTDIESRIRRARNSLFESELYHEMSCEARDLLAYNVKLFSNEIHGPLPSNSSDSADTQRTLIISLEDPFANQPSSNGELDGECKAIALSSRILLTHLHRRRFLRRSHPPPPLSSEKPAPEPGRILLPLLNFLHHRAVISDLSAFSATLSSALQAAGVPFTSQTVQTTPPLLQPGKRASQSIAAAFTAPLESMLVLSTGEGRSARSTSVEVTTALEGPTYGSTFRVIQAQEDFEQDERRTVELRDSESLVEYLVGEVLVRVAAEVAGDGKDGWRLVDAEMPELRKESEGGQRRVVLSLNEGGLVLAGGAVGGGLSVLAVWPGESKSLIDFIGAL